MRTNKDKIIKNQKCKNLTDKMQIKFTYIFYFILCSLFVISSCKHDKKTEKDSPYFTSFFIDNKEAVLRDINFNMTIDEVKKIEPSKLYEATADHLFYEFSYPTDSTAFSEYANVQYSFNENNQLDVITNNIYLNDTFQRVALKNTLTKNFDKRFGDSETNANNDVIWKSTFKDKSTDKKYNYTITLKTLESEIDEDAIGLTVEYYLQR